VLNKRISIFLPVGMCFIDYLHDPKQFRLKQLPRYIVRKSGFLLVGGLLVSIMVSANTEGAHDQADAIVSTPPDRLLKAIVFFLWPVRMFLWPTELRFYYELPSLDFSDSAVVMSMLSLLGITLGK
jgi:hypothetical protein